MVSLENWRGLVRRRMRGYIQDRTPAGAKVKTWRLMVDAGRDPRTGNRQRVSETVHGSERKARARMAQLLGEVQENTHKPSPKQLTVRDYIETWLANYVELQCSPRTVESYAYIGRQLVAPEIGAVRLVDLTAEQLTSLYRRKLRAGLSRRTVRYIHTVMRQMLAYAVRQGVLTRNVADVADPPRLQHTERPTLRVEDTDRFLEAARATAYFSLFYLLLHTGLRRGEALALRWRNVDLGLPSAGVSGHVTVTGSLTKVNGQLVVKEPKTQAGRRRVPLTPSCSLVLRQHRQERQRLIEELGGSFSEDGFVFARPEGGPLEPSTVSHAFSAVAQQAGLPGMTLHGLRHTHATMLLSTGTHPKIVQERLGHASIRETLDTYSHAVAGLQEAAAQKFDGLFTRGDVTKLSPNQGVEKEKGGTTGWSAKENWSG